MLFGKASSQSCFDALLLHNIATLYSVHHDLHSLCVRLCFFVYFVSCMQCTFTDLDPGVPYTVTVRASTAVGEGEPVSIVVFSVEQGKTDCRPCTYKELWCAKHRASEDIVLCHMYCHPGVCVCVIYMRLYTRGGRYDVRVMSQL